MADTEGNLYAIEDIPPLLETNNNPTTRQPFNNRDVDMMRAMVDSSFFEYTKRYAADASKGRQGWSSLWGLLAGIALGSIMKVPTIFLIVQFLFAHVNVFAFILVLAVSIIVAYITTILFAALVGLLVDIARCSSKYTENIKQTLDLLHEIEQQAQMDANNNPFYNQPPQDYDLEAPAPPPAEASEDKDVAEKAQDTPLSAGRERSNYSPRFEYAGGRPDLTQAQTPTPCSYSLP